MRALFSDVGIVYLHLLLPEDQKSGLPSLQARWRDFGHGFGLGFPRRMEIVRRIIMAKVQVRADRPQVFHSLLGTLFDRPGSPHYSICIASYPTLHIRICHQASSIVRMAATMDSQKRNLARR